MTPIIMTTRMVTMNITTITATHMSILNSTTLTRPFRIRWRIGPIDAPSHVSTMTGRSVLKSSTEMPLVVTATCEAFPRPPHS